MRGRKLWTGMLSFLALLILILDSRTAFNGACIGMDLCIRTVIPSLFPFFVLTVFLTGILMSADMPVLRLLGRIFRIPRGAESLLTAALLGGYPSGAQCISTACATGKLNEKEGKRLLCYCNNAGPAFLFGMLSPVFPDRETVWLIWGIQIISILLYARITTPEKGTSIFDSSCQITLSDALRIALRSMAFVCGWVVLFRVILAFLQRWFLWIFPGSIQIILSGFLELANGCCSLQMIESTALRFVICSAMLSFGGLCVIMQTMSVAKNIFHTGYLTAKLIQTAFCIWLSVCAVSGNWLLFFLLPAFLWVLTERKQKNVEIRKRMLYNAVITPGRN